MAQIRAQTEGEKATELMNSKQPVLLRRHITASFSWNFLSDEGLHAQEHHFTTGQPKGNEGINN